jgi:hypothetical protein
MATITITEGANATPPGGTGVSVSTASDGAVTHVIFGYMDGATFTPLGDVDGVPVNGLTTLEGVSNDTATRGTVADTASSTTIIATGAKLGFSIVNTSSAVLYLAFGGTASVTNHVIQLAQGQECSMYGIGIYTGDIVGVWASDPGTGNAVWSWW